MNAASGAAGEAAPWLAFYAPMKPPDHPNPSGDRRLARLLLKGLDRAGRRPRLISRLRTRDGEGSLEVQTRLFAAAREEAERLKAELVSAPPAGWLTYHCYWKAPDLLGPAVAEAFGVPYFVVEGTRSTSRLHGRWAPFAEAAHAALDRANVIFWFTERDRPALEAARPPRQRLVHLSPFLDLEELPPPPRARAARAAGQPLRLLAVAMMRAPDKTASYRALAATLSRLHDLDWRLTCVGDGPAAAEVRNLFVRWPERVDFPGRLDGDRLAAAYAAADLYVWPGVNEGFGMAYLEAQAAGLPVLAEDRPGVREVVGSSGVLAPPDRPEAFAAALSALGAEPARLRDAGEAARAHVAARHGLESAARTLGAALDAGA